MKRSSNYSDCGGWLAMSSSVWDSPTITTEHLPPGEYAQDVLDQVRGWLGRFIMASEDDLDLLALWIVHTHAVELTYTTPRMILDSWTPGAGKTTVLEHMKHLCLKPLWMSAISSDALLARSLEHGPRTLLIDEADRTLSPKNPKRDDFLAVLNSGYKVGGSRPVLNAVGKGNNYEVKEFPTFAPVAMAGNHPLLPDDTLSRSLSVRLIPDTQGHAEDSDWALIEGDAFLLRERIAEWVEHYCDTIGVMPELPASARGRTKERWRPLKRIAVAAGGRWPALVDRLVEREAQEAQLDRDAGLLQKAPGLALLDDLVESWPILGGHWTSREIVATLVDAYPHSWGPESYRGKALNVQALGRMLRRFGIRPAPDDTASRKPKQGYRREWIEDVRQRLGIVPPDITSATSATSDTSATEPQSEVTEVADVAEVYTGVSIQASDEFSEEPFDPAVQLLVDKLGAEVIDQ